MTQPPFIIPLEMEIAMRHQEIHNPNFGVTHVNIISDVSGHKVGMMTYQQYGWVLGMKSIRIAAAPNKDGLFQRFNSSIIPLGWLKIRYPDPLFGNHTPHLYHFLGHPYGLRCPYPFDHVVLGFRQGSSDGVVLKGLKLGADWENSGLSRIEATGSHWMRSFHDMTLWLSTSI